MVTTGRNNVGAVFAFHRLQSAKAALIRHDDRKVDIRLGYFIEEVRPHGHRDVLGHLNDLTVVEISGIDRCDIGISDVTTYTQNLHHQGLPGSKQVRHITPSC